MSDTTKKILIGVLIIGLMVGAYGYVKVKTSHDSETETPTTDAPAKPAPSVSTSTDSASTNPPTTDKEAQSTIASQWQWQETNEQADSESIMDEQEQLLPFTPQSVYDALQAVKIDDNGNIILDHDALISLDEALERIHNKLDSESLRQLQDLIKEGLPGKAGQQTAQTVGDYYQYLEAKEEFSLIHEGTPASYDQQTIESIRKDEALYSELQALREIHLGQETTASLFQVSDANAQFMFDSMKLELDQSLTPEQKTLRRQEIQALLTEQAGSK